MEAYKEGQTKHNQSLLGITTFILLLFMGSQIATMIMPDPKVAEDLNITIAQTDKFRRSSNYEILSDSPQITEKIERYPDRKMLTNPLYERAFPLIKENKEKAEAVKEAFLHAWNAYKDRCWGEDEYIPSGDRCHSHLHAGLTIVDSLSTLYLMNLTTEYIKARDFIQTEF